MTKEQTEKRKKYRQSEKFKESQKKYQQSEKCKEAKKRYHQTEKRKEYLQSEKYKEYQKKYNEQNKEFRKEYNNGYYKENKEKIIKQIKEYQKCGKYKESQKKYNQTEKRKESQTEKSKKYRQSEKGKEYYKKYSKNYQKSINRINYIKSPKYKLISNKFNMKRRYGLTLDKYQEMLTSQLSGCTICGKPIWENGKALAIDHNHKTGKIRELLCNSCNFGIGIFKEDSNLLIKAAEYLIRHQE